MVEAMLFARLHGACCCANHRAGAMVVGPPAWLGGAKLRAARRQTASFKACSVQKAAKQGTNMDVRSRASSGVRWQALRHWAPKIIDAKKKASRLKRLADVKTPALRRLPFSGAFSDVPCVSELLPCALFCDGGLSCALSCAHPYGRLCDASCALLSLYGLGVFSVPLSLQLSYV